MDICLTIITGLLIVYFKLLHNPDIEPKNKVYDNHYDYHTMIIRMGKIIKLLNL